MKYLNFKFIILWFRYSFSKYSRYKYLFKLILNQKPKTILEIGVYKGKRSVEMMDLAQCFNKQIIFYGFDLFEKITKRKIKNELSKNPLTKDQIFAKLKYLFPKAEINLIKGDTVKTLKNLNIKNKIDFIFIDGGHSINTIKKDWQNVKKLIHRNSLVVFDDYYDDENISKKFGSKNIIKNLGKNYISKILPSTDKIYIKNKKILNSLVLVKIKPNFTNREFY